MHDALEDGFKAQERYLPYKVVIMFEPISCSSLSNHNKSVKARLIRNIPPEKYTEEQIKCEQHVFFSL